LGGARGRFPAAVPRALPASEQERRPGVRHIQAMARTSFDWWSTFRHYMDWPPAKFSFHFITRSQFRWDTLAGRDAGYLSSIEAAAGIDVRSRVIAVEPAEGDRDELRRLASCHPLTLTRVLPGSNLGRASPEDGRP